MLPATTEAVYVVNFRSIEKSFLLDNNKQMNTNGNGEDTTDFSGFRSTDQIELSDGHLNFW